MMLANFPVDYNNGPVMFRNNQRPINTPDTCCLDVIGFVIGLYHLVYEGCMALKTVREWHHNGTRLRHNTTLYVAGTYDTFMIPNVHSIALYIMYSFLGLFLLFGIFTRNVRFCTRWLIWVGTLDLFVFLHDETYKLTPVPMVWEIFKSGTQLILVWSLSEELKTEVATEERRDNVRQAILQARVREVRPDDDFRPRRHAVGPIQRNPVHPQRIPFPDLFHEVNAQARAFPTLARERMILENDRIRRQRQRRVERLTRQLYPRVEGRV